MPRKPLSQEELEIHAIFSPSSTSTASAQATPTQRHPTANKSPQENIIKSKSKDKSNMSNSEIPSAKVKLFKEAYSDMHSLMAKIAKSGILEALGDSESDGEKEGDNEEENIEEENIEENIDEANKENSVNVNVAEASKTQNLSKPMFGLNADDPLLMNAPLSAAASNISNNTATFCHTETTSSVAPLAVPIGGVSAPAAFAPLAPALAVPASALVNNDHSYSAMPAPIQPVPAPVAPAHVVPAPVTPANVIPAPVAPALAAPAPAPLPDPSLPLPFIRHPTNWGPESSVLVWLEQTLDKCKWSQNERDAIDKQYCPDPSADHLFTAVKLPSDILSLMQSPDLPDKEYMFKRAEAEQFFYHANKDLACGLKPLTDVISALKGQGLDQYRLPLVSVCQSIASAINNLSKGRRELGRRFVLRDSAPSLFKNEPTHNCIFGFDSLKQAVDNTVEIKKVNKDLVYVPPPLPPKKKQYFQIPSHGSRQHGRQYKRFHYQYNRFNNYKGKFGGWQRGRGRRNHRGSRGSGSRQSKNKNQK